MGGPRRALRATVTGSLLVAALGACSGTDGGRDQAQDPTQLSLAVAQLLPRQGTAHALLRITNDSSEPVTVTGVGLRWSGYGGRFLRSADTTVPAAGTVDVPMRVPRERCSAGDEAPDGVVVTGDGEVERPLTASGEDYLRLMWGRRCFEQVMTTQVSLSYGERWVLDPRREVLEGHLVVQRRAGRPHLRFTGALGSVLHRVRLPEAVEVPPHLDRARVPVEVRPGNRCDEHSVGQATVPFSFRYGVELAGAPEQVVRLPPPIPLQQRITALLRRHCASLDASRR